MAIGGKMKAKLDHEELQKPVICLISSDEEEAKEDLSLGIVERARIREAKRKREKDFEASNGVRSSVGIIDICSSSDEFEVGADRSHGGADTVLLEVIWGWKKKKKRRKKKKKSKKIEEGKTVNATGTEEHHKTVTSMKTDTVGVVETEELVVRGTVKTSKAMEAEAVGISDNIVLGKLLVNAVDTRELQETVTSMATDKVGAVETKELVDAVRTVLTSKSMEAAAVEISDNIEVSAPHTKELQDTVTSMAIGTVGVVETEGLVDTVRLVQTFKPMEAEAEGVAILDNVMLQEHLVDAVDTEELQGTVTSLETDTVSVGGIEKLADTVRAVQTAKPMEAKVEAVNSAYIEEIQDIVTTNVVGVVETEELVDTARAVQTSKPIEADAVEIADNIVLRKLLSKPRYFNNPGISRATCYNCGEEGHTAVNCIPKKRKKPCYICGSYEHTVRHCAKARYCFICRKRGHGAKVCPEKHGGSTHDPKICLRCGDSGHDMFSCSNDYAPEDLKGIQCYFCKGFGHLCCIDFDTSPEQAYCYNCGQSGHTGLGCAKVAGQTSGPGSATLCYKCGEEGHFARACTTNAKGSEVPEQTLGPGSATLCYKCGEEGHLARVCTTIAEGCAKVPEHISGPGSATLCYKCGEEGHFAQACMSNSKGCAKVPGQTSGPGSATLCYKCGEEGHFARACMTNAKGCAKVPEQTSGPGSATLCYKCGEEGHFAQACMSNAKGCAKVPEQTSGPGPATLCYKCGEEGHFARACTTNAKASAEEPRQNSGAGSATLCYKCGEEGHLKRACKTNAKASAKGPRQNSGAGSATLCYKCGEEGHLKRACKTNAKREHRTSELSTPAWQFPKEARDSMGSQSLPHDLRKTHEMKNTQYERNEFMTALTLKQRNGWITGDLGDLSNRKSLPNAWMSSSTPTKEVHQIYTFASGGHISNSQSPWTNPNHFAGTPSSHGSTNSYQQGYSAPWFGNPSGGGFWRT